MEQRIGVPWSSGRAKAAKLPNLPAGRLANLAKRKKGIGPLLVLLWHRFLPSTLRENPRRMRGLLQHSEKGPFLFKCEACFAFPSKLSSAADSFFGREQPSVAAPVADKKNVAKLAKVLRRRSMTNPP